MVKTISVQLDERSYDLVVGEGVLDRVGRLMASRGLRGRAVVFTNPVVGRRYARRLQQGLARAGISSFRFNVPDGEIYKNLAWCGRAYRSLLEAGVDRHGTVIALGGGVVGDLAGFVAATYLRGVATVQVPTSLTAQIDSGIGGKTGVNLPAGKNLVGVFCQPDLVAIDPGLLRTLPRREILSGMAELIKYGVIADGAFFSFLEDHLDDLLSLRSPSLDRAISTSCRIKAAVVSADERDLGLRSILNFGHTFGHAVEALTRYRRYSHGEAVAIGMAYAARLSSILGICPSAVSDRLVRLLRSTGLPTTPPRLSRARLLKTFGVDKKARGGEVRFVLLRAIGEVGLYGHIPEEALFKALKESSA